MSLEIYNACVCLQLLRRTDDSTSLSLSEAWNINLKSSRVLKSWETCGYFSLYSISNRNNLLSASVVPKSAWTSLTDLKTCLNFKKFSVIKQWNNLKEEGIKPMRRNIKQVKKKSVQLFAWLVTKWDKGGRCSTMSVCAERPNLVREMIQSMRIWSGISQWGADKMRRKRFS